MMFSRFSQLSDSVWEICVFLGRILTLKVANNLAHCLIEVAINAAFVSLGTRAP
jgi:hypothetical protein